ncbi:hypothetical protein [Marivirga sp.]|uniref:lysophospholipid acyltransferase family protein n=1 Tax=Marivirga sp. TaxID=2018662 RepID=UPI002D806B3B|nr:hypothetical protein [Marivirga sp.]HET8861105.1 hypothetical protein [Marivirga sp.]
MKVKYYFLKALFWLLSKVPFWFYHGLSSFIGFLFIRLKLYRYKVVMDNLSKSFPDKSEQEIKKIAHQFYYHFTDLIFESIKAFGFSKKTIKKRYKFNANAEVQKLMDEKKSIAFILPHFANWEWATQGVNFMVPRNQPLALIMYKPLKNQVMENLIKENRSRFPGNYLFPKNNAYREVIKHKDQHFLLGFAADQSPANVYNSYWMEFLGRDTGVFFGVEKFSKKFNLVPVYAHVKKVARSRYEVDVEVITTNPSETAYGYITEKHMKFLEADIDENPHLWLWTHKRWKRNKPADYDEKRPQEQ